VYGNLDIGNGVSLFGRYDLSESEDANENQWNIDNEGELTIIGVEKQMTKGVKVAVNVQSYKAATLEGLTEAEAVNTLYLNLEYKF
jgi:phosphate-selective porin